MISRLYSRLLSLLSVYLGKHAAEQKEYLKLRHSILKYPRYQSVRADYLGYSFRVPDNLSFINQVQDIFINKLYKFTSLSDSPVIFDCGSNVGTSVTYFKSLFPNSIVKAYEADPAIYQYLVENLKSNNIKGVDVFNQAVWTQKGKIHFNHEGADAGRISEGKNSISVDSIRLKDELEKYEVVDLLKMDIEGAEVDVLKDCDYALSRVKNLVVEYHSVNKSEQHLGELLNLLKRNGFRYYLSAGTKASPLINNNDGFHFDLMTNIYGYR